VPLATSFTVHGEPEGLEHLATDPRLRALAEEAASALVLDAWPREHRLPLHPEDGAVRVHIGPVASADMWLQDPSWLDKVHERTGSLCEDMEAAAIGQVAALHGVPFLTIKDISNNEFHAATPFEGTESALPLAELGRRAATLTAATIDRLIDREHASQ
jgi:nucleoside phosphorylase